MKVTMLHVAQAAGVSKATVSRVLNRTGQINPLTEARVFAAIEALGYRPNTLAQALATQRSNTIGLIISDFCGPYFGTLLKQAARQIEAAGKHLIVTDGHDNAATERVAIDLLVERCCDAIVIHTRRMDEDQLMTLINTLPVPLVVMNRPLPQRPEHSIYFDQQQGAWLAVQHLVSLGHREIACITSSLGTMTGLLRLCGFHQALSEAGITPCEALTEPGDNEIAGGYHACQRLLSCGVKFTALFACNDDMAVGALRALAEHGIQVPQQVSLVGFDDDPLAQYMTPALTTVRQPISEMSRVAIDQALRLSAELPLDAILPFNGQLVVRESSQPLSVNAIDYAR